MAIANASSAPILTADGVPLKVSLKRSMRRSKIRALILVLPAFLFLLIVSSVSHHIPYGREEYFE